MNRFLPLLLIVCLVSALVSPACAFVSGQTSLIQICAADGSVQTIAIDSTQAPIPSERQNHKAQPDCAFCFAHSHVKPLAAVSDISFTPAGGLYLAIGNGLSVPHALMVRVYDSQGPPSFV
jgi:hypothetical protein